MLLYSTTLDINKTLTKSDFINLIVEWNNTSSREENKIPGVVWNGEESVRFGNDKLWLAIEELSDEDICAARYEKKADDGAVWDTDYIMNFRDMKMSVQLERSYTEGALMQNLAFNTPHFISLLIDKGYVENDNNIPVLHKAIPADCESIDLIGNVIKGKSRYHLPIVYVSKKEDGSEPFSVSWLCSRLKGIAHIFVQEKYDDNMLFMERCDGQIPTDGGVGVYFSNDTSRMIEYKRDGLLDDVARVVINYSNRLMVSTLYTWSGVNNAILLEDMDKQIEKIKMAESAWGKAKEAIKENDAIFAEVDSDLDNLKKKVQELTHENEALKAENQGIRKHSISVNAEPVLVKGSECDLYPGEIKEMVLDLVSDGIKNTNDKSRRQDVYNDVLNANDYQNVRKKREKEIKDLFKGYKSLNSEMRKKLEKYGFTITEEGKHYRLTYHGDHRYSTTIAKTGSDNREGMNIATEILRDMM